MVVKWYKRKFHWLTVMNLDLQRNRGACQNPLMGWGVKSWWIFGMRKPLEFLGILGKQKLVKIGLPAVKQD